NSETDDDKENTCPECSYSSPHHSPQCSHNQNQGRDQTLLMTPQKAAEFNQLIKQLEASQDLATLEITYQNVKNNPLYKGKNCSNNKKSLDNIYQLKKLHLQSSNNNQRSSTNNPALNKGGLGSKEYFLI